jgi:hypothetical protein
MKWSWQRKIQHVRLSPHGQRARPAAKDASPRSHSLLAALTGTNDMSAVIDLAVTGLWRTPASSSNGVLNGFSALALVLACAECPVAERGGIYNLLACTIRATPIMRWQYEFGGSHHPRGARHGRLGSPPTLTGTLGLRRAPGLATGIVGVSGECHQVDLGSCCCMTEYRSAPMMLGEVRSITGRLSVRTDAGRSVETVNWGRWAW